VICGQLCGLGHYGMKGTLVVDTPADYQAWLKERAELSGSQGAAPAGAPKAENKPPQPENKPAPPAASPSPGG
jgi:cytochrome c oxidase subunit 2